ncbi:MAG: hypothetical protein ACYCT2_07985 [Thermoplasmataceae archaeon]
MPENPGLREFMDEVREKLKAYSMESLTNILLDWAVKTPPGRRIEFLEKLSPPDTGEIKFSSSPELLNEIRAFGKRVDDGSYGEARGEDDDFYDEEQADDSWASEVDEYMQKAHASMIGGNYALARDAYSMLFSILDSGEESGHLPGSYDPYDVLDTDINESRSSYLLSIYFSSPEEQLPARMFEGMQLFRQYVGDQFNLKSVIGAGLEPLPAYDDFLKSWISLLREKSEGWARYLLREAVILYGGISGIANLAREDGKNHPSAYIEWTRMLEKEGDFSGMEKAAMEGLENVPRDYAMRARIGEYLARAGEHFDDRNTQLFAFHEAFYSMPTLDHLLSLLSVTEGVNSYRNEINASISRINSLARQGANKGYPEPVDDEEHKKSFSSEILLVETFLLGGLYKEAHDAVLEKKSLGWSYGTNPKGLVLSFFLKLLTKGRSGGSLPNVELIWIDLVNSIAEFSFPVQNEGERFRNAMEKVIQSINLGADEKREYTEWCTVEIGKRVDAIVGEKHRKSYHKAAALLVAASEVLSVQMDRKAGNDFVDVYRQKYNRHSAFQQEFNTIGLHSFRE